MTNVILDPRIKFRDGKAPDGECDDAYTVKNMLFIGREVLDDGGYPAINAVMMFNMNHPDSFDAAETWAMDHLITHRQAANRVMRELRDYERFRSSRP
jgi:hypothetical protein